MNIKTIGRKVTLRENFIALVEKKMSKFDKIFDDDAEVVVTVTLERNHQVVEVTIKQRGMFYRAEAQASEMNEAVDIVIKKLGKQIRKNKTKLLNTKKVKAVEYSDELYEEPEDEYQIAKVKKFFVKEMTVEEAILQMNLIGHEFFMFRSGETGEINVVYKRRSGDYGVLEPSDSE